MTVHKPWSTIQKTNYPHEAGCLACRETRLCNACGAGLSPHEACTNGRCRRCHSGVCSRNATVDGHGYGYPSGTTGERAKPCDEIGEQHDRSKVAPHVCHRCGRLVPRG